MKKLLIGFLSACLLSSAHAANVNIDGLPSAASVAGANLFECEQVGVNKQCTGTQILTFINSQFSGDLTVTAGGVVTLKNTGPGATGPLGSATVAPIITIDAQGRVTALSSATITPAVGSITGFGTGIAAFLATPSSANLAAALTDETGSGAAVFGTAPTISGPTFSGTILGTYTLGGTPTISSPTINTAATFGFITGSTQCLHVNTSGVLSGTGSDCGAGGGGTPANPTATAGPTAVNGVASTYMRSDAAPAVQLGTGSAPGLVQCGLGLTCTSGVAASSVTQRNNTGTTDTLLSTDSGTVVTESNASPVTVGIAVASTTGFTSGNYWTVKNKGAGLVTITPTTSQIDGAGSITVKQNQSVDFYSDGTNYWTLPGRPTNVACADLTNGGTACPANTGTSGANLPFLNGTNTWSGVQTFGNVFGTVSTQSGTTYTLASTDCGTEIAFTNAAAVTVTIPAALTTGCNIAILQTTAGGQVTVTGTAVSAATLHSGHSYTKTFGQWSIIGINIYTTGVAILTGDGA